MTCERAELIMRARPALSISNSKGSTLETMTFSVGVAIFPEIWLHSAALLRAADVALYRAKHEGRGRVVVSNQ